LKLLIADSRLSYRQIAEILGLSTATVIKRITRMEKAGIIKSYTTVLDHEKLGYEIPALIEVTVAKGKLLEVERKVSRHPNVVAVYDITGPTDAAIIAKFKSRRELSKFVKSLLRMEYVERTNTHLILTIVKEDFRLL
ncbi:MAG TPA: Lrp/AsnC family transcriptional regulator, partial [Candidatus Aenigmarchaeota archaeon]|nr:Lrp/AsnC family transcriptional regulator [Candidatus Aenigmarchaeota archaeon]